MKFNRYEELNKMIRDPEEREYNKMRGYKPLMSREELEKQELKEQAIYFFLGFAVGLLPFIGYLIGLRE